MQREISPDSPLAVLCHNFQAFVLEIFRYKFQEKNPERRKWQIGSGQLFGIGIAGLCPVNELMQFLPQQLSRLVV